LATTIYKISLSLLHCIRFLLLLNITLLTTHLLSSALTLNNQLLQITRLGRYNLLLLFVFTYHNGYVKRKNVDLRSLV